MYTVPPAASRIPAISTPGAVMETFPPGAALTAVPDSRTTLAKGLLSAGSVVPSVTGPV